MSDEPKPTPPDDKPAAPESTDGVTLPDGTKLPPISDEKWNEKWKEFEGGLSRNNRDKKRD